MEIEKELDEQLKNFKEYVALATVDAKNYQKTNLKIIKYFTQKQKIPGVYVTLNKPFTTLQKLFQREGIDIKLILFIDAVSKIDTNGLKKSKDCLFIGNPEKLSDISIAMDQAVRALPFEDKFVFFDSLSTLLVYNDVITIAKFIHFLTGKMREWKVKGIIISLEKEANKELINKLVQFCDISFDFEQ